VQRAQELAGNVKITVLLFLEDGLARRTFYRSKARPGAPAFFPFTMQGMNTEIAERCPHCDGSLAVSIFIDQVLTQV
jgi:hypothetical protein